MDIIKENYNYKLILQLIIRADGVSRAQIARETNLNRSTISYIVKYFIDNNIVFETEEKVLTGGRASNLIKFNYDFDDVMLIDLQKSKFKVLVTNLRGEIRKRYDFPINHEDGDALLQIQSHTKHVLSNYSNIKICGIAVHGIVSSNLRTVSSPFYDYSYEQIMATFTNLDLDVRLENESNIYTNGIFCAEDMNISDMINIHIKDGIGSGQISNRQLYHGTNGFAGEIGHSIIIPDGKECECGNKGCLELYCSERHIIESIEKITDERFVLKDFPMLIQSNPDVSQVYQQSVKYLSIKLNDLLLFTDVQTIYITSDIYNEVTNFKQDLLDNLHSNNHVMPDIHVISADLNIFTEGFASIILNEKFALN